MPRLKKNRLVSGTSFLHIGLDVDVNMDVDVDVDVDAYLDVDCETLSF